MNRASVTAISLAMLIPISATYPQLAEGGKDQMPLAVSQAFAEGMRAELGLLVASIQDSTRRERFARDIARTTPKLEPTLDTTRWKAPGVKIWVAFPSGVDHFHRFTIAEIQGTLFRLGGFTAPDLVALDRALPANKESPIKRATLLAALADRNGGERLSIQDSAIVRLPTGEMMVWVITESHQTHAYRPRWTRTFYSFLFAVNGALAQWAHFDRQGDG